MAAARNAGSTDARGERPGDHALVTSPHGAGISHPVTKHGAASAFPSAMRGIGLHDGRTMMRLVASSALSSIGLTLARRALRHPLVTILGLGIVAGAILTPDKTRPD